MTRTLSVLLALLSALLCAAAEPLADAVRPFVERGNLAGAVMLVADQDRTLAVEAAGYADVAAKTPLRTDPLFWIASQSKPVTGAALMILLDEGKVTLDDPAGKYLPEFNDVWVAAESGKDRMVLKRPARPVTVRDLMNHTSGLPFASAAEQPTLDGVPLKVAVKTYAMTPLNSEPGAKHAYSNAGINAGARIVEVVARMPFEEFLDTRLFAPLGMKGTTFWPSEPQAKRLAKAYKSGKDKTGLEETAIGQLQYPLGSRANRHPMPAGRLFSTADDVSRFCRMALNGGTLDGKRVLSEAAVKEMLRQSVGVEAKGSYGVGWAVGGGTFGHGGALATNMTVDPRSNRVYVWLVQHAGFPGDGAKAQDAFRKAADERFPPAK